MELLPVLPRKSNSGPRTDRERNTRIVGMFREGVTQAETGRAFGLSRGAIGRILRMYGVSRRDGGKSASARAKEDAQLKQRRARVLQRDGILPEQFPSATDYHRAKFVFSRQRNAAKLRGVEWMLTLAEWWHIWSNSGRWPERGRGIGRYCMARHGDVGPYAVGNVSIQLCTQNSRDGIKIAHASMLRNGTRYQHLGRGKGWTFVASRPSRPYQVMVSKKYIGSFATQAEAEAAYANAVEAYKRLSVHPSIQFRSPRNFHANAYEDLKNLRELSER